jgi:ABC-2 type transport system permease protein
MVKILRLSFINFKMSIKDIGTLIIMFIVPLVVILGTNLMASKGGYTVDSNIAIDVKDKGVYGEEILKEMSISENIFYDAEDKALELLERNEVVAVYQIPEDFTEKIKNGEKPGIQSFKREEGNTTLAFELNLEDEINERIRDEILLKNGIIGDRSELLNYRTRTKVINLNENKVDSKFALAMMMIIYFILLSSSSMGEKMVGMKKQNILSRAMSTANTGYEILGSLCLSILVLQVTINLAILFIVKIMIGFTISNFHIALANIILASLFSITFTMFLTRVFESQGVVSLGAVLFSIASIFLSIITLEPDVFPKVPFVIKNLGKLTPIYWLMDSVETLNLFPNAIIVLLMIIALFSAGNYKLKSFINRG